MSAKMITLTRYECRCELKGCPGKGKPWISKDPMVPERCAYCGRRTWNGQDKRKNVFLTASGKTQRLSEWAKETGMSAQLIHHRLKVGWTDEEAVGIPAGGGKPNA
jgi:hypothetical protein